LSDDAFYEIGGKKYPRVTSILGIINKPALSKWITKEELRLFGEAVTLATDAKDIAERLRAGDFLPLCQKIYEDIRAEERTVAKAAYWGNQLHNLIEHYLKVRLGQEQELAVDINDQKLNAVFARFQSWFEQSGLEPLAVENRVHCDCYGYAGTLDLYARSKKGTLIVVDWKTTKSIRAESYLQNIAYRHAAADHNMPSDVGLIIRFPKTNNGKIEVRQVPDEIVLEDFLAALRLWKWQHTYDVSVREKG
jgi:hypothetical protein